MEREFPDNFIETGVSTPGDFPGYPVPPCFRDDEVDGYLAEGVGFEPTVGCPTPVFKTGAIDHSATPP